MRGLILGGTFAAAVAVGLAAEPAQTPTNEQLARQLVNSVARVKDGDVVVIRGEARDADLLESLWVESARVGADATVVLAPSPHTTRRLIADIPEKFDTRPRATELALAEKATVAITMESTDYAATKDLPARRIQARNTANQAIAERHTSRNVRQVFVGNGLYPTYTRAAELGLKRAELETIFRAGLAVDYPELHKTATAVKARLTGKTATITSQHGTKLTVELDPETVLASDGVLTDEKVKAGGAAASVWLPAGEVYARTLPGTAAGKVVVPSLVFENETTTNLVLTFEKGKLVKMEASASHGFERLQAQYRASAAGKELLSVIDVGVNPAVRFPKAARDVAYPAAGVVTLFVGGDTWAGGQNKSSFGLPAMLRDATLTVDGRTVIASGELAKETK